MRLGSILLGVDQSFNYPDQVVGVRVPTDDVQRQFAAWWRPEYADWWQPHRVAGDHGSYTEKQTVRPDAPPRLNVMHWPTGATRWATFFTLMSRSDLDKYASIQTDIGTPGEVSLQISDGRNFRQFDRLTMLPPRPIFDTQSDQDLFLVCLVDRRWHWNQLRFETLAPLDNDYEWFSDDVGAGLVSAWAATFDDLGHFNNVSGDTWRHGYDNIPSIYGQPNMDRWNNYNTSVTFAEFLDAVSVAIGIRMMFGLGYGAMDDLEGTDVSYGTAVSNSKGRPFFATKWRYGYARRPDDARTDAESQWTEWKDQLRIGGRATITDLNSAMPDRVRVSFGGPSAVPQVKTIEYTSLAMAGDSENEDVDPGITDRGPWLDAELDCGHGVEAGDISDEDDERQDWAEQAATDWYQWRLADRVDATFNGIVWIPTGAEAAIEWGVDLNGMDCWTRVIPHARAAYHQFREDAVPHVALIEGGTRHGPENIGFENASAVTWQPEEDVGSPAALQYQGKYRTDANVVLSVPGEFPVNGHHYLAVQQPLERDASDTRLAGTTVRKKHYVASPRGYALVTVGSQVGSSTIYEATAFIGDGTDQRNVGDVYLQVLGHQHHLLLEDDQHWALETGRHTEGDDERRLYTWVGQATESVYDTGDVAGVLESLPGGFEFLTSITNSFTVTSDGKDPPTYTFESTVTAGRSKVEFGVSPHNFINGMRVTALPPVVATSKADLS